MNPTRSQLEKVIETLQNHNSGVICLGENSSTDALAAATSLYLGLTQLGKNISIASAGVIESEMLGAEKIQSELTTSGDNMVISFPYQEGSVDKIDYFIQNDKMNIVVAPRPGTQPIDSKSVNFSTAGGSIEFIIVIGVSSLRSLGTLYTENQELFKQSKVINIDRSLTNAYFGTANFVNRNVSSLSELVLTILTTMNVEIDKEMATNLYAGVQDATKSFSTPSTNASTFENSAMLLKSGAKKPLPASGSTSSLQAGQVSNDTHPQTFQINQKKSFERQGAKPIKNVERAPMIGSIEGDDSIAEDEEDDTWLKPKIFKGTGELG